MNQTRLKKILKISSFFLFAFVTYHVYYQSLVPHLTARNEEDARLSQSKYQIAYGQVRDFQKIGNFALAIDMFGDVQQKEGYIIAQNYRIPKTQDPAEGQAFYDKEKSEYFYQIDIYKEDEGIQSLRKIDVRDILLKEKKKYKIISTAKIDDFDSPTKAPYLEIGLEEINGDARTFSLIIDLQTLESRITRLIGSSSEEKITSRTNRELSVVRANPVFAERLKNLSFVIGTDDTITMRPYQGGELINLYQEYPHIFEMAKKGSFTIYPQFQYKEDLTQQVSNFANLFNYPGEAPFWSAQQKQDYEADRALKQTKDLSTPLSYDFFMERVKEEGKLNAVEGTIPIGFDINTGEIVTVDFKKGPVYLQNFDLEDHIDSLSFIDSNYSYIRNVQFDQVSIDTAMSYKLGRKSVSDYSKMIEDSKINKPKETRYITWLQYKISNNVHESDLNIVKGIVDQGILYKIFSIFSLEEGQMTVNQTGTNSNLAVGKTKLLVQNGHQLLDSLQFETTDVPSLNHDEMIQSGRIIYVLIDGQLRQVKVPEEK
ncbi:hypothetical protein HMPREF9422_0855 [Streptococcus cristatus ATCC 51100]|uniref:YycH protein n=1 Tax=Streptococcus cristatus ATCC 51100 TaxID=889201 RepID=A0AAV3EDC5_STRCR|nr:hypothetical protein [Streptococcus cristatus]EFX53049.1 hypothetical protein HMPREF9422_0855 [Streptococcus cristatus ATCC 51100]EGU66685.1 hypothetical protein HMPREF9960_1555 [Streptococcus cristatus ATCC 51100]KJQ57380.1 hypothetical protein TZ85_01718 [Streptococcus cristatus]SQG31950.1 Uncharacterised protein [Streptococcus cristatus ATCC 51100]